MSATPLSRTRAVAYYRQETSIPKEDSETEDVTEGTKTAGQGVTTPPTGLNTNDSEDRRMSEKHSTNGALRACAYYRKSTDEQEQSIDRQRDQVTRYATGRGYRIIADFKDEGIAGDEFDRRSDFQKMLAAAGRQEFEVIVVDEPSRLSRQNVIELIEKVITPLRRSGVRIDTAAKGPLDYDSVGRRRADSDVVQRGALGQSHCTSWDSSLQSCVVKESGQAAQIVSFAPVAARERVAA
jgi:predicted site-specific integrase-resolvase